MPSDTIATTHSNYRRFGATQMWKNLTEDERTRYDRAFYTIGGFIIFPTRPQSLNQRRGTAETIADRLGLLHDQVTCWVTQPEWLSWS